ncbi:MAG: acetyl/propionyl/methylcrotonyl-CoA carboxylase subunit alpha [Rickettsiales bacterium]|nr:acetyl/propionyl/methylcrotonyl-CoA carboxylase subunit alpha [Rickettsiales bacterium]
MFKKILIANRGEIAVRIMRTCRKMGIRTVAVYSEADTNSLHVKEADEAIYIGPSPSAHSYLKIENIMSAIDQSGAEAVHPGYGFLSENAGFAEALEKRGVALIGPSPNAIKMMGDKIESKIIAKKAGVNIVPGGLEAIESEAEAKRMAKKIGYPVMIKAAAGGGGKGMRVARNEKEVIEGMSLASSEAASSFGDRRVFIEKFFENPRHIEIQLLADKHGNTVYLGERECSIQRRHQKVIEEAPSSFVDEALRSKMGRQSVALAKKVGYYSAGTVEFIVDDKGNFYFLEMNTRLQVEHRVTELITGMDLVEQMIRVAAGEKLGFEQKDVTYNGWAFEARVYAEDPKRGFLPSIGRINRYIEPVTAESVLIDTGIYEGGEVSMFYDPMVSKVCTHAPTRNQAIESMKSALSAYVIEGIAHNISFLQSILAHPRFVAGDISTNFIAKEYPDGFSGSDINEDTTRVFLGVGLHIFLRDAERAAQTSQQVPGRARVISARWVVNVGGQNYPVIVRPTDYGYDISFDTGLIVMRSSWKLGRNLFQGTVNGKPVSVQLKTLTEGVRLSYGGSEIDVKVRTPRVAELAQYMPKKETGKRRDQVKAPIAGLVSGVAVKKGDKVHAGQELLRIEAMKMENVMYADADAKIKRVLVKAPESVQAEQVLIEFE